VRLRKVGASALLWSGMPYLDLGRSPHKTLGRPTWRVKTVCVPSCVPNSPIRGGATVSVCGNGSPELGRRPRCSRRTSLDRCDRRVWPDARGHRAGFASYRREPLVGTYRGAGLVIMSARAFRRRSGLRLQATDRDCYNFLYCIQGGFQFSGGRKGVNFQPALTRSLPLARELCMIEGKVDPRPRVLNVVAPSIRLVADTFPA